MRFYTILYDAAWCRDMPWIVIETTEDVPMSEAYNANATLGAAVYSLFCAAHAEGAGVSPRIAEDIDAAMDRMRSGPVTSGVCALRSVGECHNRKKDKT